MGIGSSKAFRAFKKARARIKRYGVQATATAALALALSNPSAANPSGPTVRHGEVHIVPGANAQIQQLTDRAIVDWNSFSIGLNESVRFLQPNELSVILNRVTGVDPSHILGTLEANGNVFLINPNGILFGPDSVVNVGGLVASTLSISDEDFLSGNYSFNLDESKEAAALVNQGRITITDGGYAVLTAPTVINEGFIVARAGNVTLAAGEKATLNLDGRDLVHFALSHDIGSGTVLLAPGMLSDAVATTLGVSPAQRANQMVRNEDGSVRLTHGSGIAVQAGTVSADGRSHTDAGSVLVDSADLTILTGGSVTSASGQGTNSDGGELLVLSAMDGNETFRGFTDLQSGARLAATGGSTGDGGFLEVSGDSLNLHGEVDVSAVSGTAGVFLLDPVIVTIIDGDDAPTGMPGNLTASTVIGDEWFESPTGQTNANFILQSSGEIIFDLSQKGTNFNNDTIVNFARNGTADTNVTLKAGADPNEAGNINFGTGYTLVGIDEFTVMASDNIIFNNVVIDSDSTTSYMAGGEINFGQSNITVNGGSSFTINAGTTLDFDSSTVDVELSTGTATASITAGGEIKLGNSDISLDADFGAFPIDTLIQAGTGISTAPAGGSQKLFIDGNTDIISTTGNIVLNNLDLDVPLGGNTTGASRTFELHALDGAVSLGDSVIDIQGPAEFTATQGITLGDTELTTSMGVGDILLDAGTGNLALGTSTIQGNGQARFLADGSIDFESSTVNIDGGGSLFEVNAGTNLDFGSSDIDAIMAANAVASLIAGGQIDLGSSDIFLDSDFGAFPIDTTFQAGNGITSAAADQMNSFTQKLFIDGNTDFIATGGDINLNDVDLRIPIGGNTGGASRTLDIQIDNGSLSLGESQLSVDGDLDFFASENLSLGSSDIDALLSSDIAIEAGADVMLGSSKINQNVADGQTGGLTVTSGGSTLFGDSEIKIHSVTSGRLDVDATTNIDFGDSTIRVTTGGFQEQQITAGGEIDLGTSFLEFIGTSSGGSLGTRFQAGSITSGPADGSASTYSQTIISDGNTNFIADTGGINLMDTDLRVEVSSFGGFELNMLAPNGSIGLGSSSIIADRGARLVAEGSNSNVNLGSATIDSNDDFSVFAGNTLDAQQVALDVEGSLTLAANGRVLSNGSNVSADDLEIYGFNPTTLMLDPNTPLMDEVNLGVSGDLDISVYATGDITINHTGGTLTTERAGGEGPGSAGSASAIRSTTGNVSIVSDGTVRLGKGLFDNGDFAMVFADGADSTVSVTAALIEDANVNLGSMSIPDLAAGASVSLIGSTGNDAIEVLAPGVTADASATPGGQLRVNIQGNPDYLKVKGNLTDIEINELASGNRLTVKQPVSDSVLTIEELNLETIHYVDESGITLGQIEVTPDQTLAVEVLNGGNIVDGRTGGVNVNLQGDLILLAEGDIGSTAQTVLVPGGRVAAFAGGEIHLETDGNQLEVSSLELQDPLGNVQASASGIVGGDDVSVILSGAGPSTLVQESDIRSNNGGVAIDIANGDLQQSSPASGPAPTIAGRDVVLDVNGNVGEINGVDPISEVSIDAENVVLAVTGDAALAQSNGDLTIVEEATVGGRTYSSTGLTGEDLRVRVSNGGLTLDTDLDVTGEAALVSGVDLDIPAQALPGSIILNGSVTAGGSLVILSDGDIVWQSGTLTSPSLGLGAKGSITGPVQIQTDQLSRNPLAAEVADPDGFVEVDSVTAAGVTVNQGLPVPEPEPEPEPDGSVVVDVVLTPGLQNFEEELDGSVFAQNNVGLVEDFLDDLIDSPLDSILEPDPTDAPLGWYNDDDFLKRKFRR